MAKPPPRITRRAVVKGIGASALLPLLSANLAGCSDSDGSDSVPASFAHGVASGDPLQDRVILWTRVTPVREGDVRVDWEVAEDAAFERVVSSGRGRTVAQVDYTFKVDADGLEAGRDYYYRFRTGAAVSPAGRTRSAPAGSPESARFAVVSCANYPAGFFNVYREIAGQDVDAVLHLGDYIYEYGPGGYATERAAEFGRVVAPPHDTVSLADYRTRYAQYRTDADLQACHARHPFIVVWDDHEVANNAWRDGAENHDPATQGDYSARKAAAIQAWYEWLPLRPPSDSDAIIYRRFAYGDLVDLLMLDTRHVGRDRQVDYTAFANGGVLDTAAVIAAVGDSNRTLLGADQLAWLRSALVDSSARWQVLGQQVLMARQYLPEPVVRALTISLGSEVALDEATAAIFSAVAAKNKPADQRSAAEQALLDSSIPWNADAWDGYAFERDSLEARWIYVSGIDSANYTLIDAAERSFRVARQDLLLAG